MWMRRWAVVAIGIAITLASTHIGMAEPTPTASPINDYQNALSQYKLDMQQYRTLIITREQSKKLITQDFILAVSSANSAAKSALRTAKTADAKTAIGDQLKISIRIASEARDTANTGLGSIPLEPMKPVKSQEIKPLKKTKP